MDDFAIAVSMLVLTKKVTQGLNPKKQSYSSLRKPTLPNRIIDGERPEMAEMMAKIL